MYLYWYSQCTNRKSARKMCIMLFYLLFWSAPENRFTLIHVFIIYTHIELCWKFIKRICHSCVYCFLHIILQCFCSRKFAPFFFSKFCHNQLIFFQEWSLNYTIRIKISLKITHVLFFFYKDKNKQVETYCVN